jgi:hypothetical protein
MRSRLALALTLLAVGACTAPTGDEPSTTTVAITTTSTAAPDAPVCRAGELPFVGEGVIAALDSPDQDAHAIGGVRWFPYDGCERVELSFLSPLGSPASGIGPIGVTALPESGIVRVSFSEQVADSAVSDTMLEGDFVGSWHVVEGLGEGLTVDFHLNSPADARAFTADSPARLIVDFRPAETDRVPVMTVAGGGVVVLSPQPGVGLYPLQVTGYADPDTAAVRMQLWDETGIVIDRSLSTLSPVYVWHAFNATVNDGPSGLVRLFVGSVDGDGTPVSGVDVELDLP